MLSEDVARVKRLDSSLGSVCADVAAAAHELNTSDPDEWLGRVVGIVAGEVNDPSMTSIAIVEPVSGVGAWDTHHYALSSGPRPELASILHREAREGHPHDDVSLRAGHRLENPRPSAGPRRLFIPDDAWYRSAYAAFRRPLGLHEFVRAVVPFWDLDAPRTLILQVDLTRAGASPDERLVGLVGGVAPAIVRAFHAQFIAMRAHREEVKRRLTPAQRRILPLLVEGLSETQVGATVGRSAHTVHDHTKMIYQALGVSNRLQLRDLWFARREASGRRDAGSDAKPGAGGAERE